MCCRSDAVVSQILDELGLQLNDTLSGLPQATGSLSVPGRYPEPDLCRGTRLHEHETSVGKCIWHRARGTNRT